MSERGNKNTVVQEDVGDYWVSTVRLSIDHGFGGPPLWYETMVFPQKDGEVTSWGELFGDRYGTEGEAREGHSRIVAELKAGTLEMYG